MYREVLVNSMELECQRKRLVRLFESSRYKGEEKKVFFHLLDVEPLIQSDKS